MKEQMKVKSLERQVEIKTTELDKLKEETKLLKERYTLHLSNMLFSIHYKLFVKQLRLMNI